MMELKVRRVGSSLGVLLPKKRLDRLGVSEGDTISIPRITVQAPKELYGIWKDRPVRLEFD